MTHDPAHEDLLLQLCTGDRAADDPELRDLLAGCPECARRWREWCSLTTAIDAVDRERREVLAAAAAPSGAGAPVDAEDRVRAVLQAERAATFAQRPRRIGGRGRWLLVAASLLLAGFIIVRVLWSPAPEPPDMPLSTSPKIEFLAPFTTLRAGSPIEWRFPDLPSGGSYLVTIDGILADGTPYSPPPVATAIAKWTPTADLLSAMPDQVVVRVTAHGVGQSQVLGSSPGLRLSVSR